MKNLTVKQKISLANFNHPKHLDILVHDESPDVRENVAEHGNEHQARLLLKDKSSRWVRAIARHRLKQLGVA